MIRIFIITAFVFSGITMDIFAEAESNATRVDAAATGKWLKSLFTVNEHELRFCQKSFEHNDRARIPVAAKSEIQIRPRGMLINQDGLYPLSLSASESGISVYTGIPFYAFLDYADGHSGMEGFLQNPKAEAMNRAGFRIIGEVLHAHFSKLAGEKPEWHRVIDDILYPSEHYIWKVGEIWIVLSAHDGNDNDGITLDLTKDNKKVEKIRSMKPTRIAVYPDWGEPMPHKKSEPVEAATSATLRETVSEAVDKTQPEVESRSE